MVSAHSYFFWSSLGGVHNKQWHNTILLWRLWYPNSKIIFSDLYLLVFIPSVVPSPWMWTRPSDSFLMNRINWKLWCVTCTLVHKRQCGLSLHMLWKKPCSEQPCEVSTCWGTKVSCQQRCEWVWKWILQLSQVFRDLALVYSLTAVTSEAELYN